MQEECLDEFTLDLPIGFNGENLLITKFNGKFYVISDMLDGISKVFSVEKLNENSVPLRDFFVTKVRTDELELVERRILYAKYKKNIYRVGLVSKHLESIELYARPDHIVDDKRLGFEDDLNFRCTHKLVKKEELEGLFFESFGDCTKRLWEDAAGV